MFLRDFVASLLDVSLFLFKGIFLGVGSKGKPKENHHFRVSPRNATPKSGNPWFGLAAVESQFLPFEATLKRHLKGQNTW